MYGEKKFKKNYGSWQVGGNRDGAAGAGGRGVLSTFYVLLQHHY